MRYFVTGGTGLIGRHLIERLLKPGAEVEMLVRPRVGRVLPAQLEALHADGRLVIHEGDVTQPNLGLGDDFELEADHFFHLAAVYDLEAEAQVLERVNVGGTKNVLDLLERSKFSGTLHHVSSVAVAGDYDGTLLESELDVGQAHPHAYHASKFTSERLVRGVRGLKVRIYRPSAVVGDSSTGAVDAIDGPYHLFEAVDRLRRKLPRWTPLPYYGGARVDMVPVDWVASAIDTIAHEPNLDGLTFHLTDLNAPAFTETFNLIADAACAPRLPNKKGTLSKMLPGMGDMTSRLGSIRFLRTQLMADFGIPAAVQLAVNDEVRFDCSNTQRVVGTPPAQSTYVTKLWDYYVRNLATVDHQGPRNARFYRGKVALVTGASSGIGASLARMLADNGAHVVLVARREEELKEVTASIEVAGGRATYYVADLADYESCDDMVAKVLAAHGPVDVLVNNAGRSIRRPLTESLDRFHDLERVMQINFFAAARLIRGFLPSMLAQKSGSIVNVLSAGAHMPSPRFGAYTASKAALSQLGDTLAAEHAADGIRVTQAYLHWVRTPMMDATGAFAKNNAATPDEAATWILNGIVEGTPKLVRGTDVRRYLLNQIAPRTISRLFNVVYRVYAEDDAESPELELDRTLAKKLFAGRPM